MISIALLVIFALLTIAIVFAPSPKPEPQGKPVSLSVTMESQRTLELLEDRRKHAVERASRSHARHVAHVKEKKRQATIERKRQEREARQATNDALKAAASNKRAVNTSQKVSLSGIASCIAKYESGYNPRAENPTTTASGLYQFTDGTWNNYGGYYHAADAPVSLQTERFYQVWNNGAGAGNWVVAGSCGY